MICPSCAKDLEKTHLEGRMTENAGSDGKDGLLKLLEMKASAFMMTGSSGSFAIAQFSCAKEACRAAGIPQEEIDGVVNAVAERRRV